jgi:WD40 repeat protein
MIRLPGETAEYLIQDTQGFLFRLDVEKRSPEKILSFHSGGIAGLETSPLTHAILSLGSDGSVRLYDYISKSVVAKSKFSSGGSCLAYVPVV